ncbi:hypothetical protein KKE19_03660 [Patescibacteria group bacterium]|nr:hypothetical protein [Patescibacteria group bacterium]MCG2699793.1 hypothetical protein [Candidatus Parcubacteria bacterium]
MAKKNLLLIILTVVIIVVILLVLVFIVFKKPSSVSECKDIKCVKNFALLVDFNPEDCGQINQEFKNDCYYLYENDNTQTVKANPGKYCGPITDYDLRADCFYKTWGVIIMTNDLTKAFYAAVNALDIDQCDKLSIPEIKQECADTIMFIQKAVDNKDRSLCFDDSVDFADETRRLCIQVVGTKLNNQINPTQ